MESVSVIIPTVDSSDFIRKSVVNLLDRLYFFQDYGYIRDFEVVIVYQNEDPSGVEDFYDCLKDISDEGNDKLKIFNLMVKGKGGALTFGIDQAKYDLCLLFDDDHEYPIEELPAMVKKIEDFPYCLVIGSRHVKGSQIVKSPLIRRVLSLGYRFVVKICFNLKTKDIQSGMKLLDKNAVKDIDFEQKGYVWDTELIYFLEAKNLNIYEHPIRYTYKSSKKRSSPKAFKIFSDVMKMFWKYEVDQKGLI